MRTSLHLSPVRSMTILAALAVFALGATACGTTADTTAAELDGRTISIDDVNAVIDDPAIVGAVQEGLTESRQPGDLARSALMYEIQRVAWIGEAERWGAQITDQGRQVAGAQLDQQLVQSGVQLSEATRGGAVEMTAAQNALLERFATIDTTNQDDLRLVYEGTPSRWRSWCLTVVSVQPDTREAVESALDDGTPLADVAETVEGAQLLATPSKCFAGSDLPVELERAARDWSGEGRPDPVPTTGGGVEGVMYFEVDSVSSPSFAEARDVVAAAAGSLTEAVAQLQSLSSIGADATDAEVQQAQQVQQAAVGVLTGWVQDRMRTARINPRYGSGVVDVGSADGAGLEVAPPPVPLQPAGEMLAAPGRGTTAPAPATGR